MPLPQGLTEVTGPLLGAERVTAADADLTAGHAGEPLGERIIVTGRVLDSDGRPVPDTLIEIWQANASGRYAHRVDDHPAPLDPNFTGAGRCLTDSQGRYRFVTIKPGAYPWGNHRNAWRPAHIHFSLFGRAFTQRLITQMYFPSDPLFAFDPIFNSIPDPKARDRLIASFDMDTTEPDWALAYTWDIVLRGRTATVFEAEETAMTAGITPSQTIGPFLAIGLPWADGPRRGAAGHARRDRDHRPGPGRRGTAGAGRARRDLAGGPGLAVRPSRRPARAGSPAVPAFRAFGRSATDADGPVPDRHAAAGPAAWPGRRHLRRRTWTCRCSPAGCWTGS